MRHQLTFSPTVRLVAERVLGAVGASVRPREAVRSAASGLAVERVEVPLGTFTDLVTWHDAQGDVVLSGGDADRDFGLGRRTLAGGGYLTRVHISDRPVFLKALSDAMNGEQPVRVEFRLHAGDDAAKAATGDRGPGRVVWAEMRAHPVAPGSCGVPDARIVAYTRDVSETHRHAGELRRVQLESERADELKGRFLATVSHELRTPLNAIIGFSELLGADHPFVVTEERRKEYAAIIRNSGTHLLEIVNTLLDMSKIESGNFAVHPEPFSLRDLVEGCCDLMRLKAEEAGIAIRRELASDLPDFVGDRRACRQMLINLLSNAVKFTPPGGTVTVALEASGTGHMLRVADTGIGIPEDDLPRLGVPFFQSGDVHRRHHEGTGLGLSVVKGLVGLHGGEMAIESEPGRGTAVILTFPADRSVSHEPRDLAPARIQLRPTPRQTERRIA